MYIHINIFHIYKQATIQFSPRYIKLVFIKITANLVIVITDVQHTDPCIEVILWVIVTVVVPVCVLAHVATAAGSKGNNLPVPPHIAGPKLCPWLG